MDPISHDLCRMIPHLMIEIEHVRCIKNLLLIEYHK